METSAGRKLRLGRTSVNVRWRPGRSV